MRISGGLTPPCWTAKHDTPARLPPSITPTPHHLKLHSSMEEHRSHEPGIPGQYRVELYTDILCRQSEPFGTFPSKNQAPLFACQSSVLVLFRFQLCTASLVHPCCCFVLLPLAPAQTATTTTTTTTAVSAMCHATTTCTQ